MSAHGRCCRRIPEDFYGRADHASRATSRLQALIINRQRENRQRLGEEAILLQTPCAMHFYNCTMRKYDMAPDFSVTTLDDQTLTLAALPKPVALVFMRHLG